MKTILLTIVAGLLAACTSGTGKTDTLAGTDSATLPDSDTAKQERIGYQEQHLSLEFKQAKLYNLSETLEEDFNGDGTPDHAQFLIEHDKAGVCITDGQTHEKIKIGLGTNFEEMGDNFSWVDYWGVVKDPTTYEVLIEDGEIVGDTIVHLQNPSIVVRAEEAGGGLITFRNGNYEWIHQAD